MKEYLCSVKHSQLTVLGFWVHEQISYMMPVFLYSYSSLQIYFSCFVVCLFFLFYSDCDDVDL